MARAKPWIALETEIADRDARVIYARTFPVSARARKRNEFRWRPGERASDFFPSNEAAARRSAADRSFSSVDTNQMPGAGRCCSTQSATRKDRAMNEQAIETAAGVDYVPLRAGDGEVEIEFEAEPER